jgi:hypothetical protein
VFFEIPLDQGFSAVFTDARSGERTPTGAVRRGLRPSPHRSRGEAESDHGQCSRPPRTGLSDSFGGPGATTSRRTSRVTGAGVGSDRACGHLRVGAGNGGLLERSRSTGQPAADERFGETTGHACRLRASGDPPPPGVGWHVAFGRSAGNGVVVEEPKELGPPQLDSARSVPNGARTDGTGNRVSVKRCHGFEAGRPASSPTRGIARHAARRDGRCEQVETKANARHSTSGGPVHSSSPGRCAGESRQRRPGRFRFRPGPSPPCLKIPHMLR